MTEKTELMHKHNSDLQPVRARAEAAILPAVDIFEDDGGITLHADMPGIAKQALNVSVEGNVLNIEGNAELPVPEGMEALHADIRATHYQRSFTLSSEMDTEKVDASLKNGVLTLRIPKREELKPRRIEVQLG